MKFTREDIHQLLHAVAATRGDEITCDDCLRELAEFAEISLAGKTLPESLLAVQHHLAICGECLEEYEALLEALRAAE